jgi:hypothetical protein
LIDTITHFDVRLTTQATQIPRPLIDESIAVLIYEITLFNLWTLYTITDELTRFAATYALGACTRQVCETSKVSVGSVLVDSIITVIIDAITDLFLGGDDRLTDHLAVKTSCLSPTTVSAPRDFTAWRQGHVFIDQSVTIIINSITDLFALLCNTEITRIPNTILIKILLISVHHE